MKEDLDKYYTTKELNTIFRCSRYAIYDRVNRGQLPLPFKLGGINYWPKQEITKLLERLCSLVAYCLRPPSGCKNG